MMQSYSICGLKSTSSQLYIDEKNIALHLNNPFVTDFAVSSTSLSPSTIMFNQRSNIDRPTFYGGATSNIPQSASTSQLSNVIKSHQLKNFIGAASSGISSENDGSVAGRQNEIDTNTLRLNRPKRPHSIAGVLSPALLSSSSAGAGSAGRLSIINSNNKEELSATAATATMTYNNNKSNINGPNNNTASNNGASIAIASMKSGNITSNNVMNGGIGNTNPLQKVFNQPQNNEYAKQASTHVSYGHFINSPSRLTGATAATPSSNRQPSQATSQEFSLYTPPPRV